MHTQKVKCTHSAVNAVLLDNPSSIVLVTRESLRSVVHDSANCDAYLLVYEVYFDYLVCSMHPTKVPNDEYFSQHAYVMLSKNWL